MVNKEEFVINSPFINVATIKNSEMPVVRFYLIIDEDCKK